MAYLRRGSRPRRRHLGPSITETLRSLKGGRCINEKGSKKNQPPTRVFWKESKPERRVVGRWRRRWNQKYRVLLKKPKRKRIIGQRDDRRGGIGKHNAFNIFCWRRYELGDVLEGRMGKAAETVIYKKFPV